MLFLNIFYQVLRRKYLPFFACLLFICLSSDMGNSKSVGPNPPSIPDEMILVEPTVVYPDQQQMVGLSGHLIAIFKAQGSYTFKSDYNYKNDNIKRVSLDLTMTVEYNRAGNSEIITISVNGTKTTTEDAPAKGRKQFGYSYNPSRHVVKTETYSGSSTRKEKGYAIPSVIWSKQAKLACFQAKLGEGQSIYVHVPVKIHTEEDIAYDDDHKKKSWDFERELVKLIAVIPSHSNANTRLAQLVGNNGGSKAMHEAFGGESNANLYGDP